MKSFTAFACSLALAISFHTTLAWDADVAASELPKPVTDAILKRFPKATLISADKRTANGETVYDVKFKVVETPGQCTVTPDGIIEEPKASQ
jgi:hypothetical protein